MNFITSAIGGISDEHIAEFAFVKPKKVRTKLLIKIAAAAACFAAVIMVFRMFSPEMDNMPGSNITAELWPHVYFNDRAYGIYGRSDPLDELPDGYVEVGEITAVGRDVNGHGEGPRIGEKIYQNADFPEDLYVYTTLFTGGERYRYLLFTDRTFERVRIGGKTYVWDFDHKDRYLVDLPGGYVFIGEVTTNDREYRYTDGFGQGLNIGDTIYRSPDDPDTVYVKTINFVDNYVRFTVYDTLSDEDNSDNSSDDESVYWLPSPQVVVKGETYKQEAEERGYL